MPRKIRVLVTGAGGPAGMGTIKSLLQCKDIAVVAADMNPLAAGLYWAQERVLVPPVGSRDFVKRMLDTVRKQEIDVLFPTVDEEIGPLAENIEKFEKHCSMLISPAESVASCTDKWETFRSLQRAGVPAVNTLKVSSQIDLEKAERDLGFPIAIKPMVSRGGRGLYYCTNMRELKAAYSHLSITLPFKDTYYDPATSKCIICQEVLPGVEYDVVALRSPAGKTVANVPMRAQEWDVSCQKRTIITEHSKAAVSLAEKTLSTLGLVGPIDIEMKEDRQGKLKALDVNPRVGGDIELATAAGCNIPRMAVMMALGKKVVPCDFSDDHLLIRYLGIQTMKKSDIPS